MAVWVQCTIAACPAPALCPANLPTRPHLLMRQTRASKHPQPCAQAFAGGVNMPPPAPLTIPSAQQLRGQVGELAHDATDCARVAVATEADGMGRMGNVRASGVGSV